MRTSSFNMKQYFKVIGMLTTVAGILFVGNCFADTTLTEFSKNIGDTVTTLAGVFVDLALIAGIGFIMASFFKFHQHKLNPTQVPVSQAITLLVVGAGLSLMPMFYSIASSALSGGKTPTDQSKIGGKGLQKMIGGSAG
ncbi:MAG: type IV secretion protein IcmD [Gammaproteobacteria bacterium]|nr:type IV secretion protein IcmD [Gammaproteobacteria bacterium]